ncbi:MAG: YbjN domain-containing protein [Sphingomonadaceae bacterium]
MDIDHQEMTQNSGSPIDVLEQWFAAHSWSHERVGDEEIVAGCDGSWGQYELRGIWRDDDRVLQFLAFPDIRVTEAQYSAIYEVIGLINEQLWLGHFELWSGNGSLVFRHAALLDGQDEPTLNSDQADLLIDTAAGELDRFYPVFQFVLWGGKTPAEAIAAAMVETQGEA